MQIVKLYFDCGEDRGRVVEAFYFFGVQGQKRKKSQVVFFPNEGELKIVGNNRISKQLSSTSASAIDMRFLIHMIFLGPVEQGKHRPFRREQDCLVFAMASNLTPPLLPSSLHPPPVPARALYMIIISLRTTLWGSSTSSQSIRYYKNVCRATQSP